MNNLLLVEDNPADARLVSEYLSDALSNGDRPEVDWTETLEAGVTRLNADGTDCVLLDLGLPETSGIEAVRQVSGVRDDIPVVVLTGRDDEDTAMRAMQAGADDYLRKGELTPTSLVRAIRYARERRRLQAAAHDQARRLEEALEGSPAGVATTRGAEHVFEMVNPTCRRLLDDRDVLDRPAREVFPELDGDGYFEALDHVFESGETVTGRERPLDLVPPRRVNFVFQPRRERGEIVGVLAHFIDVTEQVEMRQAVDEERRRLKQILDTVSEGVLVVGQDRECQFVNPTAERILGLDGEELPNGSYRNPEWGIRARDRTKVPDDRRPLDHVLSSGGSISDVGFDVVRPDGEEVVLSVNAAPLGSSGDEPAGAVVSLRDVTERKDFEEQLRRRALHDPLTGLPNRTLFHDRLEQNLESESRTGTSAAVLFLDIDRFKTINDSLGHEAGDRVLEEIARRLEGSVRDSDTVARMGGDEFTVLLEVPDDRMVEQVAERITDALDQPVVLGEQRIPVELSIGIAVSDQIEDDGDLCRVDALIARADEAMFRAKETAGTGYRLASPDAAPAVTSRLKLETRLRRALADGDVTSAFQPIVRLDSEAVIGAEALARWEDPELGTISPGRFIPLAEETGLIAELGRQQLEHGCRRIQELNEQRPPESPLSLHVNLSMAQLDEPDIVREIEEILSQTGFPAEQLWLEITESVTMRHPGRLGTLRDAGVRLAVDDFGTGHSTLSQLKRLELNALKIDRSFVDGLPDEPKDRAIVDSVVTLGHRLGLDVVAEGVENGAQAETLQEIGCEFGQGFLFGRPTPADEVPETL